MEKIIYNIVGILTIMWCLFHIYTLYKEMKKSKEKIKNYNINIARLEARKYELENDLQSRKQMCKELQEQLLEIGEK